MQPVSLRIALAATPLVLMLASGRAVGADRPADEADLPLTRITLYNSGVGSFERQGTVQGEQSAQLRFEADQINDILKSMVLLDLDGGRINAVTYNSKEPLARRLRSFGVDISNAPSVAELFAQLRGSRINITGPDGPIEGTILAVEQRPIGPAAGPSTEGRGVPFFDSFVSVVTPLGVKTVRIAQISSFIFSDKELNDELNKALAALAEQRAENVKTVDLSFSGEAGKLRRIVVNYVHEMPVWKTSYRLVLPDEDKAAKPDPKRRSSLTLQGWAIVENTTDQDWKEVRLSLASGRPVSFTMDLYQPLYTFRPSVPVPVLAGVGPRIYESMANRQSFGLDTVAGADSDEAASDLMPRLRSESKMVDRLSNAPAAPAMAQEGSARYELSGSDMVNYAAQAQASAGEAGESFLYTLDAPVSLDRQRSAMLPILTTPVEGQRVSIYNAAAFAKHPMRGVRMKNAALHLMPGPISVYDGTSYAGDAQIPHTSSNQERLLSYAVDLDVLAQSESTGTENVVKLRIVDGLIETTSKLRRVVKYGFTNNDPARGKVVLVEHPREPGWDLIEPAKPAETTESLYRFEAPVEAGKGTSLAVTLEQVRRQTIGLASYDLPTLMIYARDGKASQAVIDAVKKAAAIQARINGLSRTIDAVDQQRAAISADQERIRGNMHTIDRTSDLYRRYMGKFNEQETELESLASKRSGAVSERDAAENELKEYLRNLDVE